MTMALILGPKALHTLMVLSLDMVDNSPLMEAFMESMLRWKAFPSLDSTYF